MKVEDKYQDLKEVIFLAIADFIMFPDKKAYKSDHIILDRESFEHDLQDFSFTFLELGKFNKNINSLDNIIERWACFFKYTQVTNKEDLAKIIGNETIIQKAYEELDRFNWNEAELNAYEAAIKKHMDYQATLEQKYDEGLAKGLAEGEARGKVEGKKETDKIMLQEGLDPNFNSKVTGLDLTIINKLN